MVKNPECETTPTFKYLRILQRVIIFLLLFVMSLILLLATINIVFFILKNIFQEPLSVLTANNLMELFSIFLVILIGIELLETVKAFLEKEIIQVEIVVLVAIIAVARKIIIWDFSENSATDIFGISAVLLSLGLTFFLIRRSRFKISLPSIRKKIEQKKADKGKGNEVVNERSKT